MSGPWESPLAQSPWPVNLAGRQSLASLLHRNGFAQTVT